MISLFLDYRILFREEWEWLCISAVGKAEDFSVIQANSKEHAVEMLDNVANAEGLSCMQSRISWLTSDSQTRELSSLKDSGSALEITSGNAFIRSWRSWTFHPTTPHPKTKPGSKPRSNWNAAGTRTGHGTWEAS
jgi:hypothetical protein